MSRKNFIPYLLVLKNQGSEIQTDVCSTLVIKVSTLQSVLAYTILSYAWNIICETDEDSPHSWKDFCFSWEYIFVFVMQEGWNTGRKYVGRAAIFTILVSLDKSFRLLRVNRGIYRSERRIHLQMAFKSYEFFSVSDIKDLSDPRI